MSTEMRTQVTCPGCCTCFWMPPGTDRFACSCGTILIICRVCGEAKTKQGCACNPKCETCGAIGVWRSTTSKAGVSKRVCQCADCQASYNSRYSSADAMTAKLMDRQQQLKELLELRCDLTEEC